MPAQNISKSSNVLEGSVGRSVGFTRQIAKNLAIQATSLYGCILGWRARYRKSLARLLREGADLFDPEDTKQVLANSKIAQNNKKNVATILNVWYDFIGVKWKRPRYTKQTEFELPPTEKTLDATIAGVGRKCAAYLQMLKETGARCGEISALTWKNIDFEQRLVNITPEKGSNPRIIKVSQKALDMINNLPKNGERLFANADDMRSSFFMQRRRLAKKLGYPRILEVHFHSFRIWKGTEEWHRAKDLIHVQGILGHKNIQVTVITFELQTPSMERELTTVSSLQ